MKRFFEFQPSFFPSLRRMIRWGVLVAPIALVVGGASALFLTLLEWVTDYRLGHPAVLFLLPLCGVALGTLHYWVGRPVEGGSNLILEQIHLPGGGVPKRMAPLILFSTLMTHLFGGSAGREGTAVQMGGSLASTYSGWLGLSEEDRRVLLMAGVAAGFGSVFGTPFAGAVFAIEVLVIGRLQLEAAGPVLLASLLGDLACSWLGVTHHRAVLTTVGLQPAEGLLLWKVVLAGGCFGVVGLLFCEMQHGLAAFFRKVMPWAPGRPLLGGVAIIALVALVGTRDYLGLSVASPLAEGVTLERAFDIGDAGGVTPWSWWWKLLFTAVTLASGFKGGEVTPLFFIGACLGNALGWLLGAPVDFFAAVGFVSVFAGCAHTPIAGAVLGMELFGVRYGLYFAVACLMAHLLNRSSGIYLSQRIGGERSLREERERRRSQLVKGLKRVKRVVAPKKG